MKTPESKTIPTPHRFAVKPPPTHTGPCNPLLPGKWYVHVYQTKVETSPNFFITIPSKAMARQLKRICGTDYFPRDWDLETSQTNQHNIKDPATTRHHQTNPRTSIPNQHYQNTVNKTFQTLSAYPPGFQFQPTYTLNPNQTNQINKLPQNPPAWQNLTNTWQPYLVHQPRCPPAAPPANTNSLNRNENREPTDRKYYGNVGRSL